MKEKLIIRLKEKFKDKSYPDATIEKFATVLDSAGLINDENLEACIENVGSSLESYHTDLNKPKAKTEEELRAEREAKEKADKEEADRKEAASKQDPALKEALERIAKLESEKASEGYVATLREKAKTAGISDQILAATMSGRTLTKVEDIDSVFAIAEATQKVSNDVVSEKYKEQNFIPGNSGDSGKSFLSDMAAMAATAKDAK